MTPIPVPTRSGPTDALASVGDAGGLGGCEAPQEAPPGLLPVPHLSGGVGLDSPSEAWTPSFPAADLVEAAASLLERPEAISYGGDGKRVLRQPYVLELSPGVLGLSCSLHGGDKADRVISEIDWEENLGPALHGSPEGFIAAVADISARRRDAARTGRVIEAWSPRSRARLRRRLAELDYTPFVLAAAVAPPVMLTLTYPGDWLTVAPDGPTVKRHFSALWKRWARRYGARPPLLWKLEFQGRGAPHFHCLVPLPDRRRHYKAGPCDCFRCWVSGTWADIVAAPDLEERGRHLQAGTGIDRDPRNKGDQMTDPRRLATYFLKHGTGASKEYQHAVPDAWLVPGRGPGRFWGYHGLTRTVSTVPLTRADYHYLRRLLRRYMRAKARTPLYPGAIQSVPRVLRVRVLRHRINQTTGEMVPYYRYTTVRLRVPYTLTSVHETGAWACFSDVPSLVAALSGSLPSVPPTAPSPHRTAREALMAERGI